MQCDYTIPKLMGYFEVAHPSKSAPFDPQNQDSSISSGSGNGNRSDAESNNSEEEDEVFGHSHTKRSCPSSTLNCTTPPRMPVMNHGKWSKFHHDFNCPFFKERNVNGRLCEKCFRRPEHLRRHLNTIHSTDQRHTFLLPLCKRPFSRSDNLQEHY